MELLNVSHINLLFLTVFHTFFKCHGFTACLLLSPMVDGCLLLLLRSHRVAACISMSPIIAGCLSLSLLFYAECGYLSLSPIVAGCFLLFLPLRRICCMSLTVFNRCWLSLSISPCLMELQNLFSCDLVALSQLNLTGRDSKRQPATTRDSE